MKPQLNLSYVMRKKLINKEIIKKFVISDDRRKIRNGKVLGLLKSIENGIHFAAPLVINEKEDKYFLIDGNHRIDAIKKRLKKEPNFELVVWIAIYRNLTKNEEREVYKIWNIGVPQTATDFLKAYFKTIPYGKEILQILPVSIYGDAKTMSMKPLVGSHIDTKKQKKFGGGYSEGKEQTLSDFSEVTKIDILVIREFCDFMEETFGKYYQRSPFYRTTPLSAFYRIWYDNRKRMKKSNMVSAFKKIFTSYPEKWNDWTSHGGRSATLTMYGVSLDSLNRYRKNIKFLSDEEIINSKILRED